MGEFFLFMLILFVFGSGTAFLLPRALRSWRNVDQTVDNEVIARLLEDTDQLATRLSQVEEELDFFKELHAPEDRGQIPPPDYPGNGE